MGVDLVDITAKRAALTPNVTAFEDALTGRTLSYAQLEDRASRCAAVLASLGVTRGDRVAILCRNRIEFFELMFACAKLSAILAPMNWRAPAAELAPVMADCTPKALFYGAEDAETALALQQDGLTLVALDSLGPPASSPALLAPWTARTAPGSDGLAGEDAGGPRHYETLPAMTSGRSATPPAPPVRPKA
jgi:fatty-acyl-CoA synthase